MLHRLTVILGVLLALLAPLGVALTHGPSTHGLSVSASLAIHDHAHDRDAEIGSAVADPVLDAMPMHDATDHEHQLAALLADEDGWRVAAASGGAPFGSRGTSGDQPLGPRRPPRGVTA